MDDLLVFYAGLDEEKFLRDISGECYLPPLKLEDGGEATFLDDAFFGPGTTVEPFCRLEKLGDRPIFTCLQT